MPWTTLIPLTELETCNRPRRGVDKVARRCSLLTAVVAVLGSSLLPMCEEHAEEWLRATESGDWPVLSEETGFISLWREAYTCPVA